MAKTRPPKRGARRRHPKWLIYGLPGLAIAVVVALVVLVTSGGSSPSGSDQAAVNWKIGTTAVYGALGPEGVPLQVGPNLAPPNAGLTGAPIDGVQCNTTEQLAYHHHVHVVIFVHGLPRSIPLGVGMVPPVIVEQTPEGDFAEGSNTCIYWLHVHAQDGIVHIESPNPKTFQLGQFFNIWGQPVSPTGIGATQGDVTATVNGQRWNGDPAGIPLTEHAQIVLNVGQPDHRSAPYQLVRHPTLRHSCRAATGRLVPRQHSDRVGSGDC